MEKKTIFIIIGIFWLLIIGGFIAVKEFTLQTGVEVVLKTRPIDPRDLFRGDYVILRYEIGSIDLSAYSVDASTFSAGDSAYLALDIVDGYGNPRSIAHQPPDEGLFIKGEITRVSQNALSVTYGIETYFVPEGKGREIERLRGDRLEVKVAVDSFGNTLIKYLIVDGEQFTFD